MFHILTGFFLFKTFCKKGKVTGNGPRHLESHTYIFESGNFSWLLYNSTKPSSLVFDKTDFFVIHKLFIVILLMCYLNEQLEPGSHYFGILPWFHFFPLNKIFSFSRIFAIYFNFRECFQVIAVFIYEIIGSKMSSKIRQRTHFSIKISRNLSHSAKDFLKTIIPFSFSA